jgi:putative SOS response-associated peptidase YedK
MYLEDVDPASGCRLPLPRREESDDPGRRTYDSLADHLCGTIRGLRSTMPVVLKPERWPVWLGEEPADASQLKSLLAPYPAEEMTCWPVSARVGNVRNNDPSLIEPIAVNEPA